MNVIRREPVLTTILALVSATMALLAAFGVDLTDAQQTAILGFVAALVAAAFLIRSLVTPVKR